MNTRYILLIVCCFIFGAAHAQFENVRKGDIIDINGTKALVFATDGEGHGSAMSIKALRGRKDAWSANKKAAHNISAYSESDGMANTQAVYKYAQENGISLSEFPAFEWCHSLGEGWYIPAVKQMETFVNFLLGNEQEYDWDSEEDFEMNTENLTTKALNTSMLEAGGIPFINSVPSGGAIAAIGTYTSTKSGDNKVYVYEMNPEKNVWRFRKVAIPGIGKYTMGRAFYDF